MGAPAPSPLRGSPRLLYRPRSGPVLRVARALVRARRRLGGPLAPVVVAASLPPQGGGREAIGGSQKPQRGLVSQPIPVNPAQQGARFAGARSVALRAGALPPLRGGHPSRPPLLRRPRGARVGSRPLSARWASGGTRPGWAGPSALFAPSPARLWCARQVGGRSSLAAAALRRLPRPFCALRVPARAGAPAPARGRSGAARPGAFAPSRRAPRLPRSALVRRFAPPRALAGPVWFPGRSPLGCGLPHSGSPLLAPRVPGPSAWPRRAPPGARPTGFGGRRPPPRGPARPFGPLVPASGPRGFLRARACAGFRLLRGCSNPARFSPIPLPSPRPRWGRGEARGWLRVPSLTCGVPCTSAGAAPPALPLRPRPHSPPNGGLRYWRAIRGGGGGVSSATLYSPLSFRAPIIPGTPICQGQVNGPSGPPLTD